MRVRVFERGEKREREREGWEVVPQPFTNRKGWIFALFRVWILSPEVEKQALPPALNPLDPFGSIEHHPIFKNFPPVKAEFNEGFLLDFLGVRTKYSFDCGENNGG